MELELYTVMGQLVRSYNALAEPGDNEIYLDLSGIETGVYLLKVEVGNSSSTKRLIVE